MAPFLVDLFKLYSELKLKSLSLPAPEDIE